MRVVEAEALATGPWARAAAGSCPRALGVLKYARRQPGERNRGTTRLWSVLWNARTCGWPIVGCSATRGAAGVDGMTTEALGACLKAPALHQVLRPIFEPTCSASSFGFRPERAWRSSVNGRGPWWNAGASHMKQAFPNAYFQRLGLVSIYETVTCLQRIR